MEFCRYDKLGALVAVEIGGGNGMANMLAGASSELNVPVLDGDFMVCPSTSYHTLLSYWSRRHRLLILGFIF